MANGVSFYNCPPSALFSFFYLFVLHFLSFGLAMVLLSSSCADNSQFLSLIEQLQEAANREKQESNQDELIENAGDEELQELSPEANVCLFSLVFFSLVFFY